eukprot:CAMPEP_0172163422 /NCGR_PEP_ID=MMETSP1050-20130122/7264_1 /TAXON_ID=233186 /ORGANISM="Cryptomonas curvata, Strain CCAP979/52" /LENGTH=118 /DNA_ID=CAMNT_0012833613 /DNA_START=50 /DNA_END=403 /DNA_ORIENTATION=-
MRAARPFPSRRSTASAPRLTGRAGQSENRGPTSESSPAAHPSRTAGPPSKAALQSAERDGHLRMLLRLDTRRHTLPRKPGAGRGPPRPLPAPAPEPTRPSFGTIDTDRPPRAIAAPGR